MQRLLSLHWLLLGPLLAMACSDATDKPTPDSGTDTTSSPNDLRPDTPAPSPEVQADLRRDGPPDAAADQVTPDLPSVLEVASDVGDQPDMPGGETAPPDGAGRETTGLDSALSCLWQKSGGRYGLSHFTFLLTTPDGRPQSPPTYGTPDGATPWPINDFEGTVTSQVGNQLTVDSCIQPAPCQPSPYRFVVCNGAFGACKAVDTGANISVGVSVGRRVRVVWHLDNDVPGFCPGLYWLAVYDAETGPTKGNILFLGSGGRAASTGGVAANPMKDLPFSVATQALHCGPPAQDALSWPGDDYAFLFTSKTGTGTPLRLETGQFGFLDVASPQGGSQRLQLRCIVAVQPQGTDDYWNWDFWGTGEPPDLTVDGGRG
jgi:hypothetical protein